MPEPARDLSETAKAALHEYRNHKVAEAEMRRARNALKKLERQLTGQDWKVYAMARDELDRELRNSTR